MASPVPNESRRPAVKKSEPPAQPLRHGGSVTLPAGATEEDIDNALRRVAAEQEQQ